MSVQLKAGSQIHKRPSRRSSAKPESEKEEKLLLNHTFFSALLILRLKVGLNTRNCVTRLIVNGYSTTPNPK